MSDHHKVLVASYLILRREGKILLLRRCNTGYQDGNYGLPAGHLEAGESPSEAAIREASEEAGVEVLPRDVKCLHVMHRAEDGGGREYIDFFFLAEIWNGEPRNGEPEKCDDVAWFSEDRLPPNTIQYVRDVLSLIKEGKLYSER